jgi:hypothetical protein
LGAVITKFTGINLDGYMGLAVAAFITVSGVKLLITTADPLLGDAPTDTMKEEIKEKMLSYSGVLGVHDLMIHEYGAGQCFASAHCEVDSKEDLLISHDLVDNIEREVSKETGVHLTIHMDPIVTDDEYTNKIKAKVVSAVHKELGDSASIHDFRMVIGTTHTNLIFDIAVPYSINMDENQIRWIVERCVEGINKKFCLVLNVDRDI